MKYRVYPDGLIEKINKGLVLRTIQIEQDHKRIHSINFLGEQEFYVSDFHEKQPLGSQFEKGYEDFLCSRVDYAYINYGNLEQAIVDMKTGNIIIKGYNNSPTQEGLEILKLKLDGNLIKVYTRNHNEEYVGKIDEKYDELRYYLKDGTHLCTSTKKIRRVTDFAPDFIYSGLGDCVEEYKIGDYAVLVVSDNDYFNYQKVIVINQKADQNIVVSNINRERLMNILRDTRNINNIEVLNVKNKPYFILEGKEQSLAMVTAEETQIGSARNYNEETKKSMFKNRYEKRKLEKKREIREDFLTIANAIEESRKYKPEEFVSTQTKASKLKVQESAQAEELELGEG